MKISKNEIAFIYNSKDIQDRESLGYALSMKNTRVREIDVQKYELTELQLEQLADKMDVKPHELINKQSYEFKSNYSKSDLSLEDALKIMSQNPTLMKTPIILREDSADFLGSSYELIKEKLELR